MHPKQPVILHFQIVIFIHGCFWHLHNCSIGHIPKTNVEFWKKKLFRNVERDKKNIKLLEEDGWKVIIIWECELKNDSFSRLLELGLEIEDSDL